MDQVSESYATSITCHVGCCLRKHAWLSHFLKENGGSWTLQFQFGDGHGWEWVTDGRQVKLLVDYSYIRLWEGALLEQKDKLYIALSILCSSCHQSLYACLDSNGPWMGISSILGLVVSGGLRG